jgi:hypothetical protein
VFGRTKATINEVQHKVRTVIGARSNSHCNGRNLHLIVGLDTVPGVQYSLDLNW